MGHYTYRLGERRPSHRSLYASLAVLALLAIAWWRFGDHLFTADTHIDAPPAVVTSRVAGDTRSMQQINEPLFSFQLPTGWKAVKTSDVPAPTYSWQSPTTPDTSRWLSIYVDTIPKDLAVNRETPVQAAGDHLEVTGDVSDNCIDFSTKTNKNSVRAKWENVDFICDTGNYTRDVVGTGSLESGVNTVVLTSPAGATHRLFFTYTDNSATPDYTIFTSMLQSFRLK